MTRNLLRPVILAFCLIFGSSLVWYSVASAQDDPVAPATDVAAPADEAPTAPVATDTEAPTAPVATDTAPIAPATSVTTAPASESASPALSRLINLLIDVLAAVLLILMPYFAHRLIAYFEKKTSLELAPVTKDKINALLDKGIAFAEEQAHKAVRAKTKALTMSEKLEFGAGYVMDLADVADAKNWTIDKVKKMLEARLGELRVTLEDPDVENVVPA